MSRLSYRTAMVPSIAWRHGMLIGVVLCAGFVRSDSCSAEPLVAGYERFKNDSQRERQAGQILLRDLGCVNCHADQAEAALAKPGPVLTTAASRLQPDFLRRYLRSPQEEKAGATMPDVLAHLEGVDKERVVEQLVHYLATLGDPPQQDLPPLGSKRAGERLYHQVGCVACHGVWRSRHGTDGEPAEKGTAEAGEQASTEEGTEDGTEDEADEDEEGEVKARSRIASVVVPLPNLAGKYTLTGLSGFLANPHAIRSGGRMPNLLLNDVEAQQIAAYLLDLPEVSRLTYAYYEGSWQDLPDFSQLEPKAVGPAEAIDVAPRQRDNQFGLRFQSQMNIAKAGEYKFHLGSDDGSRLVIDSEAVVVNGGVHPYGVKSVTLKLTAGKHDVLVDYFEQGGEERLTVEVEGPGLARGPLNRILTTNDPEVQPAKIEPIEVDRSLAAQGRSQFATLGCAACHHVEEPAGRVASVRVAPRFEQLVGKRAGCFADPKEEQPHYGLTAEQSAAIVSALAVSSSQVRVHPESVIETTLANFNCYACHQRGELGGVADAVRDHFQTSIPEMGFEGAIPPPLTGAGDKLRREYLDKIMSAGVNDRPYMLTRMPKFNVQPVKRLPELLAAVDYQEGAPDVEFQATQLEVKSTGRTIVGDKGFSCIKCHTFGRYKATGIQSIDMQAMSARLNDDWLRRYLANPIKYRPGTRMPTAWPLIGDSLLEFFDSSSEHQIAAVAAYLEDGERMRLPSGLVMPAMELVPVDEAILYRNFIQGSGARAIAVGYPEGVHQSFDANQLRLALLWTGRFMDASRHWSGRGQGFQPPAGDKILTFSDGPSWAALDSPEADWPTESAKQLGQRFLGYRLTPDQRPTFRYRVGDALVDDKLELEGLGANDPVVRRLLVNNRGEPVAFRVAVGNIQPDGDQYRVDNRWSVRVEDADGHPLGVLQNTNGAQRLLVMLDRGEHTIRVLYRW